MSAFPEAMESQPARGFLANLFSMGVGTVLSRSLVLISLAYTGRVLGGDSFGLLNFGSSVTAYAAILVGPGLLVWGTRAIARDPAAAGRYLLLINALQLILAGIAYFALQLLVGVLFGPRESAMAAMAGVGLFSIALSVDWAAQGVEKFRLIVVGNVLASLLVLAGTLVFVRSPDHVFRVPLITALAQSAGSLVLFVLLCRQIRPSWGGVRWRQGASILREGLRLGVSLAMVTVLHYANNVYLQYSKGSEALAEFSASFRLVELLTAVPGIISGVFLPRLSRLFATDVAAGERMMVVYVRLVVGAAFLAAVMLAMEGPGVIELMYGGQYRSSGPVLRVLSFSVLFNFCAIAYINGLLATGQDRRYFGSILAALILSVIGGAFFVPRYGIWGATGVVSALDVATWLVALGGFKASFHRDLFKAWVRPLVGAALTAGVLYAASHWGLPVVVRLGLAVLVYGVLVVPWATLQSLMESPDPAAKAEGSGQNP